MNKIDLKRNQRVHPEECRELCSTAERRAFTLIEILVAIFVLEIGILGIATFYVHSLKVARIARNETIAANLASGILDEQLDNNYDNLTVGVGTRTHYSTDTTDPFYNWEREIDIAYIDSSLNTSYSLPDTHMKKITATIYWQEYSEEKSFQTASIKSSH